MTTNPELSIVSPCFNEEDNIPRLYEELSRVCKEMQVSFELILVENGSQDNSFEIMESLAADDPQLKIVRLSRNFTYQGGIAAGMAHARGNYLVCIDADLQDPVDLIPELYKKAVAENYDIVYGIRRSRQEGLLLKLSYRIFYRTMQNMTPFDLPLDAGDFAIINRKVLNALLAMPEKDRFLRGLRAWVGFRSTGIPYDRGARERGKSKFSSSALFLIAFQGLFSFSFMPLRILFYFGLICLMAVIPLVGGYVAWRILDPAAWPPGTATIIILLFVQVGLTMAGIGLLGQYFAIVFSEVKNRPTFITSELVNIVDNASEKEVAMKVVILCGGMGMRIRDVSDAVPKPMVDVGGRPILWHVMKTYAHFGYNDFVLCLGYKQEIIKNYFVDYKLQQADLRVSTKSGNVEFLSSGVNEDWNVTLVDTGLATMTAARVKRVMPYVDTNTFMLTYADGLADIDLDALVEFHSKSGAMGTVSAVHPAGRFGELDIEGDKIVEFNEKPQVAQGYINGGYMVLQKEFVDRYITEDPSIPLERAPLMTAAQKGDLAAYRHDGWWQCMDTMREHQFLGSLWAEGQAPWKLWD